MEYPSLRTDDGAQKARLAGTGWAIHSQQLSRWNLRHRRGCNPLAALKGESFPLSLLGVERIDVAEQRARFAHDQAMKQELYGNSCAPDEEFLQALGEMPASSGIALGVDRLAMLVAGVDDIKNVLWVPVSEPIA